MPLYVVAFVSKLDITALLRIYGNVGAPHFPVEIMLAILMYANIKVILSTRKIEDALKYSMSFIISPMARRLTTPPFPDSDAEWRLMLTGTWISY
ncbi:MAG: transposase [Deltaproteobacteria bacterium]|nr:transposase [Deltaproteobacteria bacterium]